jgi:Uma2 family endonuclease
MSSVATVFPPEPSPEPIFRLSVKQYHAMIDAGVLTDDDPVELLEGMLVFKMPKKPQHRLALRKLYEALSPLLPPGYFMLTQEPITLRDSEPEPDAAVVKGTDEDFAIRHPGPQDVPLVIEIADTTLARDRGIKLRNYAAAKIEMYWIVDLVGRAVEIYTTPDSRTSPQTYADRQVFDETKTVPFVVNGKKLGEIPVLSILP